MSGPLNVVLLMDEGWIPDGDRELLNKPPKPLTEYHVARTLRDLGHQVRIVGVGYDAKEVVAALGQDPPDLVFNLVEQFGDRRRLDAHVAGLLDLLGLLYTGTGPTGLMLCRDKGLCKQLLSLHKISSPQFVLIPPGRRVHVPKHVKYPLIVKPQYEDASEGIALDSIVHSQAELDERVRLVHEQFRQVAIAEEYVEGRELYVGVIGNATLTVLPAREIVFGGAAEGGPTIATRRVKRDDDYRRKWKIEYEFADLPAEPAAEVARVCKRVFRTLQLRDYARIDLRLTPEGKIKILEANANPDIAYGEDFAEAAEKAGIDYRSLIDRIIRLALKRRQTPAA